MNIYGTKNKFVHIGTYALIFTTLLLPVQAAENVPIPKEKPTSLEKLHNIRTDNFKAFSIISTRLFPVAKRYPNNYKPLSAKQSKIYKEIFKAQSLGDMKKSIALMKQIKDKRLMGHVLYKHYMHSSYNPHYKELQNWLRKYSDHPNADKIYNMALIHKDHLSDKNLTKPLRARILSQVHEPTIYHPKRKPNQPKHSASSKLLYNGEIDAAYELASQISDKSGEIVPNESWVAGLALWQKEDFSNAAIYFERTGKSAYASGWLKSAGFYWAARCYKRTGNKSNMRIALENAAKSHYTFYGLLATQSLGENYKFNWKSPQYTPSNEDIILSSDAGKRAFSLVAAGQYALAESELLRLNYKGDKSLQYAVLSYATHIGLNSLSLRLGSIVKNKSNNKYYDTALYPVTPWQPEGGYRLDSSLINAIIRQESRFNQNAKSYSGARGLMQIMPDTANYIAKIKNYSNKLNEAKLNSPEFNMRIGQDYLEYLLNGRYVKGNVMDLLIAYNAGPGNLLKWRKNISDKNDQLLFIETLPVKETRDYVERVLSNYWIYRKRAGLDQPSLIALSSGKKPQYAHVMNVAMPYQVAEN